MFVREYSPLSFVVAVRSAPVAVLVTCTLAPGTTAPDESVICPTMLELADPCAIAESVDRQRAMVRTRAGNTFMGSRHILLVCLQAGISRSVIENLVTL
jgi:hypothetical protein